MTLLLPRALVASLPLPGGSPLVLYLPEGLTQANYPFAFLLLDFEVRNPQPRGAAPRTQSTADGVGLDGIAGEREVRLERKKGRPGNSSPSSPQPSPEVDAVRGRALSGTAARREKPLTSQSQGEDVGDQILRLENGA